jgi:hypothetical protein
MQQIARKTPPGRVCETKGLLRRCDARSYFPIRRFASRLGSGPYWDNNVSKGPGAWPVDDVVSTGLSLKPSDTLALAIMIEKDEGIDVVTSEIEAIRSSMATVLRNHEAFMASNPNSSAR